MGCVLALAANISLVILSAVVVRTCAALALVVLWCRPVPAAAP